MRFKLSKMFLVVILLVCFVFAQDVNLTGKVLDKNNNPMSGVVATLSVAGISDTTGSDGVYHLVGGIGIKNPHVNSFKNGWKNSRFYFLVTGNKYISIDIRNLLGRHVANIFSKKLSSGRYFIIPGVSGLAKGTYIVSLNVNGKILYSGKVAHLGGRKNTVHTRLGNNFSDVTFVATKGPAEYTLSLMKEGQIITVQEIDSLIDTLDDVFIVQRDVYGDLAGFDTANTIEAVITGDSIPEPKIVELWYNVANNSYSGFVYFIHIVNVVDYNVFVKVYDDSGRFIGRSVDVPFTSNAGDIEVPIFDIENAKPWVSLGDDDTVSIYDTIYLKAIVVDSFRTREIVKWEWDINGSGFVDGSGDTAIVAPDTLKRSGKIITIVKVMDVDSNMAIDTQVVTVVQDVPVATASITATGLIWQGDQIQLNGAGTDVYGKIVKWEWNTGGAFVDATPDSNLMITVSGYGLHEYVLRVTDDDSNRVMDTVVAKVYAVDGKMSLIVSKNILFKIGGNSPNATEIKDVEFSRNFWMDITEVTQADYDSIMGVNPSNWKFPNYPVENVTWFDAVLYCNVRSNRDSLDTVYAYTAIEGSPGDGTYGLDSLSFDISKNGYRLPTEAEWEYACRGNNFDDTWFWGNDAGQYRDYAWCGGNSDSSTHIVGTKQSNDYRLYDIIGNVFEWTNNWYLQVYTDDNGGIDPIGPPDGYSNERVIRGAYYGDSRNNHYMAIYRSKWYHLPDARNKTIGFRTVRTVD